MKKQGQGISAKFLDWAPFISLKYVVDSQTLYHKDRYKMTEKIKLLLKPARAASYRGVSDNFVRGVSKVISLNGETDFADKIATLRLSDREVLAKDARSIGQDMWDVLEG